MASKPDTSVGTRWRFNLHGAVYEIVEGDAKRKDYVLAKAVSSIGTPIGGTVELSLASLGTTYKPVSEE